MRNALILLATLGALTACGSTADKTSAAPASTSSSVPTAAAPSTVDPSAWISQYRSAYPALAAGRSDQGIADDGARVCSYLAEQGMTRETYTRRLSAALERNGVTPSAEDVAAIAKIGVATLCPDQQQALDGLS